jgi:outer membrane receptor protein involved in Fe transport
LDGNPIAGAPDFTANLHLSYASGNSSASFNTKYVGSFYTDNTKNDLLKNDAYIVCDLSLAHTFDLGAGMYLKLRGEVRNLFDNLYTMYGEGNQFFPAAERNYVLGFSLQI